MTYEPIKHRFLDLIEVSFCAGQEAEKMFKVPWEPLKHRFVELTQIEFLDGQEIENVQSDMRALETSLSRSHLFRILS